MAKYSLHKTKRMQQHPALQLDAWTDHGEEELEAYTGATQQGAAPEREVEDGVDTRPQECSNDAFMKWSDICRRHHCWKKKHMSRTFAQRRGFTWPPNLATG